MPGLLVQVVGDGDQRVFGHALDAGGDVGVALVFRHRRFFGRALRVGRHREEVGFGRARRAEQIDEALVVGVFGRIVEAEVIHVQAEAAVRGFCWNSFCTLST